MLFQWCLTLLPSHRLAHQVPLSMGFFRQEHWNRLPCPPQFHFYSCPKFPGFPPNLILPPEPSWASLGMEKWWNGFCTRVKHPFSIVHSYIMIEITLSSWWMVGKKQNKQGPDECIILPISFIIDLSFYPPQRVDQVFRGFLDSLFWKTNFWALIYDYVYVTTTY